MEGISPSTDINTSKVGRESNKNEFLKAKCYSLPMLRGTIILRDISRGLELHLLNAVLGQHYIRTYSQPMPLDILNYLGLNSHLRE